MRKPHLGAQLVSGHPLARGLVSAWLFNESGGAKTRDSGPGRNDAVINIGNPSWTSVPEGYVLNFPSRFTTGYVQTSLVRRIPNGSASRTVTVRALVSGVSSTSGTTGGTLMYMGGASGQKYAMLLLGSGAWYLFTDGVNAANNITVPGSTFNFGVWYTLSFMNIGGGSYRVFRDGQPLLAGSFSPLIDTAPLTIIKIGERADVAQTFEGLIAFAMVHERALTATEIAILHRDPYAMFRAKDYGDFAASLGSPFFFQRYVSRSA